MKPVEKCPACHLEHDEEDNCDEVVRDFMFKSIEKIIMKELPIPPIRQKKGRI